MIKVRGIMIGALLVGLIFAQHGYAESIDQVKSGDLIFDSNVNVVLPEPDGGALVGGDFSKFQKMRVPSLVRLKPDGTLDTAFGTMKTNWKGTVDDIARMKNGSILVLGRGLTDGITPPVGIARLSSTGVLDREFASMAATFPGISRVFVLKAGEVVLLQDHGKLSRLTDNGMLQRLKNPVTANVTNAAATPDGKLLVALEEDSGWKLERWTADGKWDMTFTSSIDIEPPPLRGTFGIELSKSYNRIVISGFKSYSNAGNSGGLQKGDVLIEIAEAGKKPVKIERMEVAAVQALLEGKARVPVTFTVERKNQGSGSSQLSVTFRRQAYVHQQEDRQENPYQERPITVFSFEDSGSVVVAPGQHKEGQQKIVRLLPDGKKDNRFNRVPRDLPPDELEKMFDDIVEADVDSPEPELIPFTEYRRQVYSLGPDSSVVEAMAADTGGKTIIGLSDGHVLRLEPDGSLDEKFHLRYEAAIRAIVPAKGGRFWVLHDRDSNNPYRWMNMSLIRNDGKIER